jgi:chromosome segregation ATPase
MAERMETSILTDLKVEIAMLKQEVSFINKLFEKMDTLINKIDAQHDTLVDKTTKVESNLTFTKEELTELYSSLEKSITREIKTLDADLSKRIRTIEDKTGSLFEAKWMGMGIIAAITWLISNLDSVKKLFN